MIKYLRDKNKASLKGQIAIPSDKSICHRAILFSSIAEGRSEVKVYEPGRDNLASLRVMQNLGVDIKAHFAYSTFNIAQEEQLENISETKEELSTIVIEGKGLAALRKPDKDLYCGNSGTTARLLCGILASAAFETCLTGDASLSKRPFKRVAAPLSEMGAKFSSETMPLKISGGNLKGFVYHSPIASAQVKSAILLAGLGAKGEVAIVEPRVSRDHTERMFSAMGIELKEEETLDGQWKVSLPFAGKRRSLQASDMLVPGDFSAAAFFMVAASLVPGSSVLIPNVGFNKTRIGLFSILERMGAKLEVLNRRQSLGEEVVDLRVFYSPLSGVSLTEEEVLLAIDEIPIFCIAAALARGKSRFVGARELRVKESDRLNMMAQLLRAHGILVEEFEDGLEIQGDPELASKQFNFPSGAPWQHCGDHRIVMSSAVLSYLYSASFIIENKQEIETSFPNFTECFQFLES